MPDADTPGAPPQQPHGPSGGGGNGSHDNGGTNVGNGDPKDGLGELSQPQLGDGYREGGGKGGPFGSFKNATFATSRNQSQWHLTDPETLDFSEENDAVAGLRVGLQSGSTTRAEDVNSILMRLSSNVKKQPDGCSVPYLPKIIANGWWKSCCNDHDACYDLGGGDWDRLNCDLDLRDCMNLKAAPGSLYYIGVRVRGGTPEHWKETKNVSATERIGTIVESIVGLYPFFRK